MQKRISTIPFTDTPEQHEKLLAVIESLKNEKGAVMAALHKAQDIYGYLPIEVQKEIARGLDVSLEEVYGVSTFYSQFSLTPKGKYNISICLGTACYVKGADKVLDRLVAKLGIQPEECTPDGVFSLTACRCIGACGLAPVLTVNEDVYGRLVPEDVDKILGLNVGADDYVTKPFNPLELVARVKSQLRRYTTLSSTPSGDAVYEAGGLVINDELKKVTVDGEEVKLTPIEYNILLLLMKNKGKVFSISQIYEEIWNEEAIGADNTVAVHIRHIREKIEINPKEPRYLKVVWGVGYKIEAGA